MGRSRRRPAIPIVAGGRGMDRPKRSAAAAAASLPDDALARAEPVEMLSNKAVASRRSGGGTRVGRLWLRPAAASGRSGGGIGRLRLRPAISVVPGGRSKRRRRMAVVPLLPDDALVEILSRVPAKSLCRFKCVSRAWRDLIADRLRCSRLHQTLEGFFYLLDGGDNEDDMHISADSDAQGCFINTLGKPSPLASYSFLKKEPTIEEFGLLRSCNGLLLLSHWRIGDRYNSLGYIVCNPATEQWVAVPSSGWKPDWLDKWDDESEDSDSHSDTLANCVITYLIFNPAVPSHFQLIEFWMDLVDVAAAEEIYTYLSETGVWCQRTSPWGDVSVTSYATGSVSVSGMLQLGAASYVGWERGQDLIVAVDGEGKNRRIIRGPEKCADVAFVGESQGCLHYMNQHKDNTSDMTELSIWVLKDYDTEEWVLKHSVTFLQLFGRVSCISVVDYRVVAIHPDRNLIFFFQHWDQKLKSYDMDSQEVCTLHTLGAGRQNIIPYVPYYAESSALSSKHSYCPL